MRVAGLFLIVALAQAQEVTDTKEVSTPGGGHEVLRKINGRWFSEDNREVNPPGPGGMFWVLDSQPGVVKFHHHRPFDLRKAELLHLWMTPDVVEPLLGKPNRTFGDFWFYYAANGIKVSVWMPHGELIKAEYEFPGHHSKPVESVAQDLGGRDVFKLGAERASKKVQEQWAQKKAEFAAQHAVARAPRSSGTSVRVENVERPAVPGPAPPKRIITPEGLAATKVGEPREDLIKRLGEPSYRTSLTSDEGTRETFTYHLSEDRPVLIRLLNGKVVQAP